MRYFFVAVTAILCFGLVLFGPQAAAGAAEGFELFISCVFPSLFPFFVCVALLKGLRRVRREERPGRCRNI